ncbi:fumarate reductase subunit C [Ectothiorhodospira marina]|uniref:Fumarate reductase subunit C n=1 Tax=Ectothiorhodospira marina TaxID=1396821 RepID=A0A1H7PFQ9_9GAMM|nr:fumarate reductase subunit C [Ectothiorhodospira marina]SEL34466.1 fumarate reductase subunit C [Ectothiorhodospira marina]
MNPPRTYTRGMQRWWLRRPSYQFYLLREGTSVVIALYGVFLLMGMAALAVGPGAFEAWRAVLFSPLSWLLHLVVLAAFTFHAWTWFKVLPLTVPPFKTRRFPRGFSDATLNRMALWAWGVVSLVILVAALRGLQ